MQYLDVKVQNLDCINLQGLKLGLDGPEDKLTDKLLAYQRHTKEGPNYGIGTVALRVNPIDSSRFLILDGHHTSYSSYVFDKSVSSVVYEKQEEIPHPLVRENFERSPRYHQTATLLGRGRVPDLMDERKFKLYLERLKQLKDGNANITEVIRILEEFWIRTH